VAGNVVGNCAAVKTCGVAVGRAVAIAVTVDVPVAIAVAVSLGPTIGTAGAG
jgi:hypothetical protein